MPGAFGGGFDWSQEVMSPDTEASVIYELGNDFTPEQVCCRRPACRRPLENVECGGIFCCGTQQPCEVRGGKAMDVCGEPC